MSGKSWIWKFIYIWSLWVSYLKLLKVYNTSCDSNTRISRLMFALYQFGVAAVTHFKIKSLWHRTDIDPLLMTCSMWLGLFTVCLLNDLVSLAIEYYILVHTSMSLECCKSYVYTLSKRKANCFPSLWCKCNVACYEIGNFPCIIHCNE